MNSETVQKRPQRRAPRRTDRHSLRSLSGKKIEHTLPRAFGRATYDHSFYGFSKLTCHHTCAEFLHQLLGVILSRPAYVHPSDVYRYASLIHEFSVAEVDDIRSSKPSPVAKRRIHRLDDALDAWVRSYVTSRAASLLPTFVLDAARLIQAHAWGETFSAERAVWTLNPMISDASARQRRSFPDRAMKHQISSSVSRLVVSLVIPQGCCVLGSDRKQALKEGDLALFQPDRGHLSDSPDGPVYPFARTEDGAPLKYDIGADLTLSGRLWRGKKNESGPGIVPVGRRSIGHTAVPGRWMTGSMAGQEWQAIPRWTP